MEKLTWLASERRVSQEGESEEDNSQEDNSEPEEEEEEEAEGMDSLQKEDGAADGAVGGLAEKPPAPFASPEAAPEAESSRTPAGGFAACPGQVPVAQRTHREASFKAGWQVPGGSPPGALQRPSPRQRFKLVPSQGRGAPDMGVGSPQLLGV